MRASQRGSAYVSGLINRISLSWSRPTDTHGAAGFSRSAIYSEMTCLRIVMADTSTSEAASAEGHQPSKPRQLYLRGSSTGPVVVPCGLAGIGRARKCSRHIRRSDTISDTIRMYGLNHWPVNN